MEIVDGYNYLNQAKDLILEYTKQLNRDLSFQNLEVELQDLSQKYSGQQGCLLVALQEDEVIGMVAYHRHDNNRCEMKRLYVKPAMRNLKVGQSLAEAIIDKAKQEGYQEMVLDTIEPLQKAIALYQKLGFYQIDAYYDNPMDDVIYMKKDL